VLRSGVRRTRCGSCGQLDGERHYFVILDGDVNGCGLAEIRSESRPVGAIEVPGVVEGEREVIAGANVAQRECAVAIALIDAGRADGAG
jgi:hypothetical protein